MNNPMDEKVGRILTNVMSGSASANEATRLILALEKSDEAVSVLFDHFWVCSFTENEEEKARLQQLLSTLIQEDWVTAADVVAHLDVDFVPAEIQTPDVLRRKRTQAKTKRIYNIPLYNLLSECPEGFSVMLESLSGLNAQTDVSRAVHRLKQIMGEFSLCPNKCLSLVLSSLCVRIDDDFFCRTLIEVVRGIFPISKISSVVRFHLLSFGKTADENNSLVSPSDVSLKQQNKTVSDAPPVGKFGGPTPDGFMRATARLVNAGLVDLQLVWPIMTPSTEIMIGEITTVFETYEAQTGALSKSLSGSLVGGSSSSVEEGTPDCVLAGVINCMSKNLAQTQKFQLIKFVFENSTDNSFPILKPYLSEMSQLFRPIPIGTIEAVRLPLLEMLKGSAGSAGMEIAPSLLKYLGVYLGCDPAAIVALIERAHGDNTPSSLSTSTILSDYILPALAVNGQPNPFICSLLWEKVLSFMDPASRYRIYERMERNYEKIFPLRIVKMHATLDAKNLLKRVVKGAQIGDVFSRNSHYEFSKICCANPVPALRYMLSAIQIHFNVNLIEPYVEVTSKVPAMSADIMGFLFGVALTSTNKQAINNKTGNALIEPWLSNLAEFAGLFFKRHANCSLEGIVKLVSVYLSGETTSHPLSQVPARILLESIIEHVGNFKVVHQLNSDQIECVAGGPTLNALSLEGKGDGVAASNNDRSKSVLKSALLSSPGLVRNLVHCLSKHLDVLTTSLTLGTEVTMNVKLLGALFDGTQTCLLRLINFLAQECSTEEYSSLVKGLTTIDSNGAIQHHVRRKLFDGTDSSSNNFAAASNLFWNLALFDIHVPVESYSKHSKLLADRISALEQSIEKLATGGSSEAKEQHRATKKELFKLKETSQTLTNELSHQLSKNEAVLSALRSQVTKKEIFITGLTLTQLVAKRVFLSVHDSLFCAKLAKLFTAERVNGFDLIEFFDTWTNYLANAVFCVTEGEIKCFAEFVREAMTYALHLRKLDEVAESNHAHWEANLTKSLVECLNMNDFGNQTRNCLLLISKTCDGVFPVIEANAMALRFAIDSLANNSRAPGDIATLAKSLSRKITLHESEWMDKATAPKVSTTLPPTPESRNELSIENTTSVDNHIEKIERNEKTVSRTTIRSTRPIPDRKLEEDSPARNKRPHQTIEEPAKRNRRDRSEERPSERPSRTTSRSERDVIPRSRVYTSHRR